MLFRVVLYPLHLSPLSRNMGIWNTFWRMALRFWWTIMAHHVQQWVLVCTHFQLENISGHMTTLPLNILKSMDPFDVIFMDLWSLGEVLTKSGGKKMICGM